MLMSYGRTVSIILDYVQCPIFFYFTRAFQVPFYEIEKNLALQILNTYMIVLGRHE